MKLFQMIALGSALTAGLVMAQTPAAPAPATQAAGAAKTAVKEAKVAMPAPTAAQIADAKAKGMVWANENSKVFHKDGEFYGTTKHGKFMTEADAVKEGYRMAKEPQKKVGTKTAAMDPKK